MSNTQSDTLAETPANTAGTFDRAKFERPVIRALHALYDSAKERPVWALLTAACIPLEVVSVIHKWAAGAGLGLGFGTTSAYGFARNAYYRFDAASARQDPATYKGSATGALDSLKRGAHFAGEIGHELKLLARPSA